MAHAGSLPSSTRPTGRSPAAGPALFIVGLLLTACPGPTERGPYVWKLPVDFPTPAVPASNPMSEAKVTLGRFLFYDARLSLSETRSCSSCHLQALGFSSGGARGPGLTHQTRRNVIGLSVPAYMSAYLWADSSCTSIEDVVLATLNDPDEFGSSGKEAEIASRLAADPRYPPLFARAFPGEPVTFERIAQATSAFVRTIISGDTGLDRYWHGVPGALSASATRGMDLFFSETLECYHCHGGFTLSASVTHSELPLASVAYDNTSLYDVDGQGAYPAEDQGLIEVTHDPQDMGRFKAPSLRNVAVSAPYMHDGSIATLREVLDAYLAGGRSALDGGTVNPYRSSFVRQITLTEDEKADVLAFLESLTDAAFLADPAYSNPLSQ